MGTIKRAAYGVAGTGLCGAAVIPGTVGAGFIAVGNKLLGLSAWMSARGNEYKRYSLGLDDDEPVDEKKEPEQQQDKSVADSVKTAEEPIAEPDVAATVEEPGKPEQKITVVDDDSEKNPNAMTLAASLC